MGKRIDYKGNFGSKGNNLSWYDCVFVKFIELFWELNSEPEKSTLLYVNYTLIKPNFGKPSKEGVNEASSVST